MRLALRKVLKALYPGRALEGGGAAGGAAAPGGGAASLTPSARRRLKIAAAAAAAFVAAMAVYYFNLLVSMQSNVEAAQAQIDAQMQRRKDIVANLTLMVSAYARHEQQLMRHTSDVRAAGSARAAPDLDVLQAALAASDGPAAAPEALLARLFAVAEQYPALRLNENYLRFMDSLVDAENRIAEQRMKYNDLANVMNTVQGTFPGYFFSTLYGFKVPELYSADPDARTAPRVSP